MSTHDEAREAAIAKCPMRELAEQFDPLDAEAMYAFYSRARPESPIFYNAQLDVWVVTRYEDIHQIMKDTDTFSAAAVLDLVRPLCPAAGQVVMEAGVRVAPSLVDEDPPDHTRRRKALRTPFTPDRVKTLIPRIEELVDQRLDAMVKQGQADLVSDFMYEVPALVVFALFGMGDEELETVRRHAKSNAKFGFGYPTDEEQIRDAENIAEYWRYAEAHVAEMLPDPSGDDCISEFIRNMRATGVPEDNDPVYFTTIMMQLLFAGHETTSNSAGNMFRALLENREQWDAICADPDLVPNAVEECLRYATPVPQWRRRTRKRVTIGGVDLPEGTTLMVALASANHDEAHFGADSDQLDISRANAKDHMAFGWGRHRCLGEAIARQELQIALRELTRRLPHIQLVPGQSWEYSPNTSHRGIEHVYVTWDPSRNPFPDDRRA